MNFVKKISIVGILGLVLAAASFTSNAAAAANAPVASLAVKSPVSGNVEVGQIWNVRWTSQNYPAANVSVNLVKQIGTNPNRYVLVRTIAKSTSNDGIATWVVAPSDEGTGLSLEVACTLTATACTAGDAKSTSGLAVMNTGKNANTAAAFQAIEQWKNK